MPKEEEEEVVVVMITFTFILSHKYVHAVLEPETRRREALNR